MMDQEDNVESSRQGIVDVFPSIYAQRYDHKQVSTESAKVLKAQLRKAKDTQGVKAEIQRTFSKERSNGLSLKQAQSSLEEGHGR